MDYTKRFVKACLYGNMNKVKYLIKNYDINIHVDDEYAFRIACLNGHLELVKYLISLEQNIDIHAENDFAFIVACSNNYKQIATYLCSLTKNYFINYTYDTVTYVIKDYSNESEKYENILQLDIPKSEIYKYKICEICLEETQSQVLFSRNPCCVFGVIR